MPQKGEVQRKIKLLKAGEGVKAPFAYWHQILVPETRKEYPTLSKERQSAIAGARWKNISKDEKIKIVRKWQPRARTRVRKTRRLKGRS